MARVVVIGGGFGGLASALRLAKLGHAVTLVEERELGGALVPVTRGRLRLGRRPPTRSCPPSCATCSARPGGRWRRSSSSCQLDCLREHWFEDGTSLVLSAGRTPAATTRSTRSAPGLGTQWVDHVASYADDWEVLRREYAEVALGPRPTCRAELAARLDSRESLHRRLRRTSSRRAAPAGRGAPVRRRRSRPPRRARLGRAHGVPRAAVRRLGRSRAGRRRLLEALVRRLETRGVAVVAARAARRRRPRRPGGRGRDDGRRPGRRRGGVRRRPAAAARARAGTSRRTMPALPAGDDAPRAGGRRARPARTSWWCTATRCWWCAPSAGRPPATTPGRCTARRPPRRGPARRAGAARARRPRAGGDPGRPLAARPGRALGRHAARRAWQGRGDGPAAARAAHAGRRGVRRGGARDAGVGAAVRRAVRRAGRPGGRPGVA